MTQVIISILRPAQWIKNLFLCAPLFFSPSKVTDFNVISILAGFLCFSILSSSIYIINDIIDRKRDVLHPVKRLRPIASGKISVKLALLISLLLFVSSITFSIMLSKPFFYWCIAYGIIMVIYSAFLKNFSLIDIMIITGGFIIRVEAGASIIEIKTTAWFLILTTLISMFLAFAKRRDDLLHNINENHRKSLSGYNLPYVETSISITAASLLISYILFTLDPVAAARIGTEYLYTTIPIVLFGILRYLQLIMVLGKASSPEIILTNDKLMACAVFCWLAIVFFLIYF